MAENDDLLGGMLGEPLLLLGIMYYIAENKPKYTGFESGKELLGIGFGNASADWITNRVKKMAPDLGLTDDMIEALAGAMIVKYGGKAHDIVPLLGQGVLIDVIQNSLEASGMTLGKIFKGKGIFGGKEGSSSEGSSSSSSSESSNPTQNTGQQWVTP